MGFVNNTISYVTYQVVDSDLPREELRKLILEGLTVGRISQIDVELGHDHTAGFALFDDPLSIEFSEDAVFFDPLVLFSFRMDKLTVPANTARLYIKRRIQERLDTTRRTKMPREEREEISDSVKLELLRRALPSISAIDVVWDMNSNRIRFYSNSASMNEEFLVRFNQHVGLKLRMMNGVGILESRLDERELEQVWHLLPTSFLLGGSVTMTTRPDKIAEECFDDGEDEESGETDNV